MAHHVITLVLSFLLSAHSLAQQPQQPPLDGRPGKTQQLTDPAEGFLDAHNKARAEVGVGPLKWSPILANATAHLTRNQKMKNCQFADLSKAKIRYGANQVWARGQAALSPRDIVGAWLTEKRYYDHVANTCIGNHQCGSYTQVVWRKSMEVGCAQASYVKDGSSLTVCFYNPPGNIVGENPY